MTMGNQRGVKRDFEALEIRRFQAVRLVNEGVKQTEVARRLQVSRQTVNRWIAARRRNGEAALSRSPRAGRKPGLNAGQLDTLRDLLTGEPAGLGYGAGTWTCRSIALLIQERFGVTYHPGHVWRLLGSIGCESCIRRG
jgi:transposase